MKLEQSIEKIDDQIKTIQGIINDPHLCEGTQSTFSRISGYYRALNVTVGGHTVGGWNKGKLQEYMERLEYSL